MLLAFNHAELHVDLAAQVDFTIWILPAHSYIGLPSTLDLAAQGVKYTLQPRLMGRGWCTESGGMYGENKEKKYERKNFIMLNSRSRSLSYVFPAQYFYCFYMYQIRATLLRPCSACPAFLMRRRLKIRYTS